MYFGRGYFVEKKNIEIVIDNDLKTGNLKRVARLFASYFIQVRGQLAEWA